MPVLVTAAVASALFFLFRVLTSKDMPLFLLLFICSAHILDSSTLLRFVQNALID